MKKFLFSLVFIFASFFMINDVSAATAKISVTSSKNRVIVGETVTVTVKVSSTDNLGSWQFEVSPSSNLSLVSSSFGGLYIKDVVDSATQKSKTYTFVFKAKSSGTGKVSVKNSLVYSYGENIMSTTNGSVSFSMMTYAELQATYSKNNNLSSLKVEGYDLTPVFNKDTLEYNLEVENGVESAKITATKEDSTASIKGTGDVSLVEGINTFEVVVTAQNGSTKTYKVNITVKELSPIEVDVNGSKYSVIRKKELLPKANMYYEETTVKINDEDVPAYYNEAASITLVGLRNEAQEAKLYIYDNGNYKLYDEVSFNQLFIQILPMDESLLGEGYTISKVDIGDKSVAVYSKEGYTYPVLYGLNIETGEKNLYKYDALENTLQRMENIVVETNEGLYFIIIISMFGFIVLSYLLFIILLIRKNRKRKMKIQRIEDAF